MDKQTLREYALTGARNRLESLRQEQAKILGAFPELKRANGALQATAITSAGRGRKKMTAKQRKEVSKRMKSYWASRRKASK
jgi:hypothetical protein